MRLCGSRCAEVFKTQCLSSVPVTLNAYKILIGEAVEKVPPERNIDVSGRIVLR
jgi:hypothetical protein